MTSSSIFTKPYKLCAKAMGKFPTMAGAVLVALSTLSCSQSFKESKTIEIPDLKIMVDQFGYRPQDPKVAVVISEIDSNQPYELKNAETDEVIEVIEPIVWADGAIHTQSGVKALWVDFSKVKAPGSYVIVRQDGETRSAEFEIDKDVYKDVLVAATKMFFYQRSGYPKTKPFADERWTDGASYIGTGQDTQARYVKEKENPLTEKVMHGGWFDAGDTNKYVTYALQPVHQLLSAYGQNPKIWTDDFNIPESGNGIPDLLDEIKFELDWLIRMQDTDGGAFIKLGTLDYDPPNTIPSKDTRPRYYGPKCSSSTITLASVFAHAAVEMRNIPELEDYATELTSRARQAWDWFQNNPVDTDCDDGEIKSGDADMIEDAQMGTTVSAAVYLFAATGDPQYSQYVVDNLSLAQPYRDGPWSRYDPWQGDALIFYSQLPNGDSALKEKILSDLKSTLLNQHPDAYGNDDSLDPFRSYMPDEQYHWGSNMIKSNYGSMNYDPVMLGLHEAEHEAYIERSLGAINYIHGVNPLGMVYLTNMYEYGAESSANEMYHQWLGVDDYQNAITSKRGPAPGFLTGGPNQFYAGDAALKGGPPMKVYVDKAGQDVAAWEITEPAIYYQSAYVKLLSKFVTAE